MNTIRCAIIKNNTVCDIILWDKTCPLPHGTVEIPPNTIVDIGYDYEEGTFQKPCETTESMKIKCKSLVNDLLDSTAQTWGYDGIVDACTYAEESIIPTYQNEGKALRAWRSLVMAARAQIIKEVEEGTRPIPTTAQFMALLPPVARPT